MKKMKLSPEAGGRQLWEISSSLPPKPVCLIKICTTTFLLILLYYTILNCIIQRFQEYLEEIWMVH